LIFLKKTQLRPTREKVCEKKRTFPYIRHYEKAEKFTFMVQTLYSKFMAGPK
jgi:hypothetical protein